MSRRIDRLEEACKEELSEILRRETKDPRVGFVTITQVKLTADLRHARVYVSIMGTDEEVQRTLAGLESAKGHLRTRLGKHLRLKYLPEIEFNYDQVTQEALRLEKVMKRVRVEQEVEDGDQETKPEQSP